MSREVYRIELSPGIEAEVEVEAYDRLYPDKPIVARYIDDVRVDVESWSPDGGVADAGERETGDTLQPFTTGDVESGSGSAWDAEADGE